jgi:hypothetical protein
MSDQSNERFRNTYIWTLEEEMKKKDTEIERLREALKFYASFSDAPPQANIAPLMIDRGSKARAALKGDE